MSIYMQNILDHYKNPHHKGEILNCKNKCHKKNQLCGDELTIYVDIKNGVLNNATFEGKGCAISQAATSILLDGVIGMKIENIIKISKNDIIDMLGIELGPTRLKCALLGLEALHNAISQTK